MTATVGVATSGSRPELINDTYQRLLRLGFDDAEATNLTAFRSGFRICARPWTVREVTHLLFLRESYRDGRRWSDADDRADGAEPMPAGIIADRAPVNEREPSSPASAPRPGHPDSFDGRVTLLTLYRSMAGPNATLDLLRHSTPPQPGAAGDLDGEKGR